MSMSEMLKIHQNGQWELLDKSKNVRSKRDVNQSEDVIEQRLVTLAQKLGLKPVKTNTESILPKDEKGIRQFQRKAKDNELHYDDWAGLKHELAHKMVTPEGQHHVKWGQHLASIADNPQASEEDRLKVLHHETSVHFAQDHLNKLAGIARPKVHESRVDFSTPESATRFMLRTPTYKDGKLNPAHGENNEKFWASAQNHAKQQIADHMSGHLKFSEDGVVTRIKPLATPAKSTIQTPEAPTSANLKRS